MKKKYKRFVGGRPDFDDWNWTFLDWVIFIVIIIIVLCVAVGLPIWAVIWLLN